MSDDDETPEILTRDQLRFEIKFGLQQVGKAVRREWTGKSREKSEQAHEMMVETILVRFDGFQVTRPAPMQPPFWNVGNRSKL